MAELVRDLDITDDLPNTIDEFIEKLQGVYGQADIDRIYKAYIFSEKAHAGQIRRSGEPYISHPLSVASILADLRLDVDTIVTGLLHDTVEDTTVTLDNIRQEFGDTVAHLVDGVTKISQMTFRNTHEKQGENIRKMILAMGKDVRVILVKIADRLHNMRTLNHMQYAKQAKISEETLDIYAPLAGRLGMNNIKVELEDTAFRYALPDRYYELAQKVAKKKKEREKYIEDVIKLIESEVSGRNPSIRYEVNGRPKHLYSIYKKMQIRSIDYEQVFDVLAFRVVLSTVPECYEVLGIVHSLWTPIPGRFKDFIAMPKANNYQSLHTTVIGPGAERIEIQIRTRDMNLVAEKGIAAHWSYKEESRGGMVSSQRAIEKFNWLRELINLHQQSEDSDEFLEDVKSDLFDSEIYVFTPNGDVKDFPDGATPIDFAYAIHTDLGHRIVSARVNGKQVPLKYRLQNGDNVEVITSKNQTPSKDWLKFCVTSKARSKIRQYVKNEQRRRAGELGKEILEKLFRKHGHNLMKHMHGPEYEKFLKDNGCAGFDELAIRVGYGKLPPTLVLERLAPSKAAAPVEQETQSFIKKAFDAAIKRKKKSSSLVQVDGMDDVLVHFAKCCHPIPGDSICGFITLGRGITVHRVDCQKAFSVDQARRVEVEWSGKTDQSMERMVRIRVMSHDIQGLLKNMTEVISSLGINIYNAQIRTTRDSKAVCVFDVNVRDTVHLEQAIAALQKIKGIIGVARVNK